MPPIHIHARCAVRVVKYSAANSQTHPMINPVVWLKPSMASRSRLLPPSTVQRLVISWRKGESAPDSADCAVTANTKPDSKARKLPLADKMSKRLAHPRVMIMPAPNNKPPTSAPDKLPRVAS